MTEFCALSHAESARHIAQTPVFGKCSLSVARDGSLGLADQLGEASLAVDQRQVAQVVAVMLNQGRKRAESGRAYCAVSSFWETVCPSRVMARLALPISSAKRVIVGYLPRC